MRKTNIFKSFFEFTHSEIKGITIFIMMMLALFAYRELSVFHKLPTAVKLDYLSVYQEQQLAVNETKSFRNRDKIWQLHAFNPNKTKAVEFREMGFSDAFIRGFFQYRSEHGFVNNLETFFDLDNFTQAQKDDIKQSIDFGWQKESHQHSSIERTHKTVVRNAYRPSLININTADSIQIQSVKGIGPVLSARIVKYRNKLGGFVHADQLLEVYGVDSIVLSMANFGGFGDIIKLQINQLDKSGLGKHPYIGYALAGRLVKYREQHGPFKATSDLLKVHGIDEKWLSRIGVYLSFE